MSAHQILGVARRIRSLVCSACQLTARPVAGAAASCSRCGEPLTQRLGAPPSPSAWRAAIGGSN